MEAEHTPRRLYRSPAGRTKGAYPRAVWWSWSGPRLGVCKFPLSPSAVPGIGPWRGTR